MQSVFFAGSAESASALIAHWCLFTSKPRASVALQEKVFQLYLWAAADRVSLEGARQTSTSNHWKLFLSSNMFIYKPTGSYFTCPPLVQTLMSFEVASIGRRWQRQRNSSLV